MSRCLRVGLSIVGAGLLVILVGYNASPGMGEELVPSSVDTGGEGYVYLFDVETETFVFTWTLPLANANPWDVDALMEEGTQDVWFTESGADRIGRLIYTDTQNYSYQAYDVGTGCSPLNLEVDGDWVWFTAPGCDQVGRLSRQSGNIETFAITPTGSYPADLTIAGDGSVWFTQMQADQLAHLVVTSTVDYDVSTFQGPTMEGGQPYGVALVGSSVYVAQTENDKVSEYTPSTDFWVDVMLPGFDEVDYPYKLTTGNSGAVWGTERSGNQITRYTYGTFAVLTSYDLEPAGSVPMGLAVGDGDYLWFTQWGAGQIGTLATQSGNIAYYPFPSKRLLPAGIDVESQRVWVVATKPYQVYLPLVTRSGG